MNILPTNEDFKKAIEKAKMNAANKGEKQIEIQAKDIHKELGHYPGPNHRMSTCCDAMYASMNNSKGDTVIDAPKKGKGANLKIQLKVPPRPRHRHKCNLLPIEVRYNLILQVSTQSILDQ